MTLAPYIQKVKSGHDLNAVESQNCLHDIFNSDYTDTEIADLLHALSEKGEAVSEIVGFANAMRAAMTPISLSSAAIDLCGTGGVTQDRFNVSTAAAFVVSACGVPVAKHGNRGSRKPNGSFDFLEKLGIPIDRPIPELQHLFNQTHLVFLFARTHHTAMKKVAGARKVLGKGSIFNVLGPLCNPAKIKKQIIGTTSEAKAEKLAQAVQALGMDRVLVIVGGGGFDELTLNNASLIYDVYPDKLTKTKWDPKSLTIQSKGHAIGGDAEANAALFHQVFSSGDTDHDVAKIVALNAAAALVCWGKQDRLEDAYMEALGCIGDKRAYEKYLFLRGAFGPPQAPPGFN